MKVEIKDSNTSGMDYPKVMATSDGLYVLFAYSSVGTVIKDARAALNVFSIGYSANNWTMSDFTDFHGTITLSNGEN